VAHKIVVIKSGSSYYSTDVAFDRSLLQIQAMLEKHKCSRIALQKDMRGDYPTVTLLFEKTGLPFIIEFPITLTEKRKGESGRGGNKFSPLVKEINMQISGRVIHDRIKAQLIEVELGMQDFEQALLPYLLVRGKDGRPEMLQDFVLDRKAQLAQGTFDITYQLPGGRS
jgi:hypothetical protein